jgi:hypothetical protein
VSYLRYLCLFAHSGVQQIRYCVVFLFCLFSSCVPYDASFSGLSILYCPFGILCSFRTRKSSTMSLNAAEIEEGWDNGANDL